MNARETILNRRAVLAGGALVVAFASASRVRAESLGPAPLPEVTGPSPDPKQLDSWIRIGRDGRATLLMGKCDIGQGASTAMSQIAAEELDLGLDQIEVAPQESGVTPDQGEVDSSSTVAMGGVQVRAAAAEARLALLTLAAARLQVPIETLQVHRGAVSVVGAPDRTVSYGDLVAGRRLELTVTGKAQPKRPADYRIVGSRAARADARPKVSGAFEYMQSLRVPGMLHGRVVRPPQGAYGAAPELVRVDEGSIAHIPGARVLRKGAFVGVVAPREWDAVRAARALKVEWRTPEALSTSGKLYERMRGARTQDTVIDAVGDVDAAFAAAPHRVEASYAGPYQGHAPFAPNCAIADVRADGADVISTNQGVYASRYAAWRVLQHLPITRIRARHYEGAGCYGAGCYHDATQAAALMSLLAGAPVRVQFMRGDEFGWDNFGPAHLASVKVAADAQGRITAYQYDGWQHGWINYEASEELATGVRQPPSPTGISRVVNKMNVGAMYDLPSKRLVNHHISILEGYLRGAPLRSPLDLAQTFASEQAIDELAAKLGLDPIEFRRRNMTNPHWLGVMEAAAKAANWSPRPSGSAIAQGPVTRGRGVGLGTHLSSYGAAVAEVEVERATGAVRVTRVVGVLDCGLAVNPAVVEAQIIGMCTQAASRTLKEEVAFDGRGVTSLDWNSYPVLRFDEHPKIVPIVLQRPEDPSTGAGEEVMGATTAAIANAVYDATRVRFRELPLTPKRVLAGLAAA